MNTKLLLLVVYCLSLLICCQQKNKKEWHDLFINCLIDKDLEDNSVLYGDIIVFCNISDKDELGYLNIYRLQILFNHDSLYLKMGYPKFIKGIIQQDVILDKKEVKGSFIPDNRIISKCEKSFSDFLTTYTKYVRENEYSVRSDLTFNEEMTVIYCLYQHNYYTGFDDVIGLYFSEKIDLILQRSIENIEIELQ